MAKEKPTSEPLIAPAQDAELDAILSSQSAPLPEPVREAEIKATPPFQSDAFLSGAVPKPLQSEPARKDSTPTTQPQIIKRGGIGLFTAFLMSSVAAIGGAYLALFVGARPDLIQQAGIAGFLPKPPPLPSLGIDGGNMAPLAARVSAIETELLALKTRMEGGAASGAIASPPSQASGPVISSPKGAPTVTQDTPPGSGGPAAETFMPSLPGQPPLMPDAGALKGELAGIAGRVTAIETRLAALDPTGAGGAIVAGLQADIAGLKAIISTLQQQAAAAPSPAATFAVVNLAEAANRSGPFMIELETVRAAMPGVPEVAALEPFARTGVPTRTLLQERFATLKEAEAASAAAIASAKKETGLAAWFRALFSDMVKVQPAPNANDTGSSVVLTRAKEKLDQGDLSGSISEVATIPTPSSQVTEWLADGRKRLELESRISAVRGAVGRGVISPPANSTIQPTLAPSPSAPVPAPVPVPTTKTQGTNP
jgi:hypothetical protein